jgi:hypothetical protein
MQKRARDQKSRWFHVPKQERAFPSSTHQDDAHTRGRGAPGARGEFKEWMNAFFVTIRSVEVDLLQQLDLGKHSVCSGDLGEDVSEGGSSEREARDQE